MFNIFKKKNCKHDKNYRNKTYLSNFGTPMVDFECFDCGFKNQGYVYTDAEDYEVNLIIVKKGIEVFKQLKS